MSNGFVSIGIDISKDRLDLCVLPSGRKAHFTNTPEGIAELIVWLQEEDADRIVCEPSGGYERSLVRALQQAGLPVALVNARWVRDFARAKGILAKTDRLDAEVLSDYGTLMKPPLTPAYPSAELALYVGRRRQIADLLKRERQHHAAAPSDAIKAEIAEHITLLEARLERCEGQIRMLIASNADLAGKQAILTSCRGIGEATAACLLAGLPELGSLSHGKITALVGLAPFNCDSGSLRGTRHIRGGRSEVRTALYMATLSAKRYNDDIRALYERLRTRGKPAKVAITACARKLLLTLNSLLRDGRFWTPEYPATTV